MPTSSISEIYLPGSSGDDQEKFPTFPVADGDVKEAAAVATTDDGQSGSLDIPEDLTTLIEEAQISTTRPTTFLGSDDVYPGGDADGLESGNTETRAATVSADRDSWSVQGDYLVRTHKEPRAALFSPLEVPEGPPPIELKHVEVLRTTELRFSGQQWPTMGHVER